VEEKEGGGGSGRSWRTGLSAAGFLAQAAGARHGNVARGKGSSMGGYCGTWSAVGSRGPVALAGPKGIAPIFIFSNLFK
jgi:hypothetical protein